MGQCRVVVLISGNGSNLQALIDASHQHDSPYRIVAVISNQAMAFGLERARQAGITTLDLDHRQFASREAYDEALAARIDDFAPDLIALAGFMRILTTPFVSRYLGRLLNIHPSLLPHYTGLHTHQRVIEAGESEHGATVHFVTEELDGGPAICQAVLKVNPDEDAGQLAQRVLAHEHLIYPLVINWYAQKRMEMVQGRVLLEGQPLAAPIRFDYR